VASADEEFAQYAILHTNEPVIALGGYTGNDPVLSTTRLKALVDADEARSFLLEPASRQRTRAARGISQHCTLVPKEAWQPVSFFAAQRGEGNR